MSPSSRLSFFGASLALAVALLGAGCGDSSRMFSGRWISTQVFDEPWFSGQPELMIGHFGPELTGVVHFFGPFGQPAEGECACAFIDDHDVDLEARSFVAFTNVCPPPNELNILVWELELVEDDDDVLLRGRVFPGNDSAPALSVRFRLDDSFVPDELRECVE